MGRNAFAVEIEPRVDDRLDSSEFYFWHGYLRDGVFEEY